MGVNMIDDCVFQIMHKIFAVQVLSFLSFTSNMKGLIQLYFVLCFLLFSFHFNVHCSLSSLSFNSSSPTKLCPHDQSFALIQFKNSLSINCSDFNLWCLKPKAKTIFWKVGTDCCLWDGVKCDTETGNVIGLDLTCSCLRGTIPSNSSLFLLHHFQELNLAYNDFRSSGIAFHFGQFTKLTHLNISGSGFTGTIPLEISHLSKLLSLDLSENMLTFEGHVFEKLLGNLTQLRHLLLSGINMSLVVPTSFLNMSSYITTLTLADNGLKGKFPVDVFRFPCLLKLSLLDNDLEINFPKSNWSASLRSLIISYPTSLGELPDSIGNLRSLEVLDLSLCDLKGSISASLGNLRSLEVLVLSSCALKGSIPASLGNLTRLNYLDLSYNLIHGPILFSFSDFKQLSLLDLQYNNLVGEIINAFRNLTKLFHLSLGNNGFSGLLPFSAFNLTQIEYLDFSMNKFEGTLPYHVSGLSRLPQLNLDFNFLCGKIPSWLFTLPSLVYLWLNHNNFTGFMEQSDKVAPLEVVNLQNNEIHGPIPSFSKLVNLTFLDLSSNKLNGIFELDKLSKLNKLGSLDLSNNTLISLTSRSTANYSLPSLWFLGLSYCNISEFPDVVRNLQGLGSLDLSYNRIRVIEADMLLKLESLEYLDLHSNLLEGPLLLPKHSIRFFSISKNKLIGEIPSSICNLVSLEILDLSDNNLCGAIPECLGSGALKLNLQVMDLQINNFHGNIPDSFVEGNVLKTLNLNKNDFDGPLPKSLMNCHDLELLNLGNNKINDTFPHWLGTLPQLQVLVLRANYFHGQIIHSENESHFSTLRILDLSHNEFSGFLPTTYFKSFKSVMNLSDVQMGYMGVADFGDSYQDSMVVTMKGVDIEFTRILTIFTTIDMSSNKFEGKIPEIVGKLSSLQVLNFSHNKLTGHIPSSLGNLTALESLDLSSNKLIGEIPMQLTGMKFLEVLNLSQNQLVGLIPQGNQFNTFLNDSYGGNLGLCGFPVSKTCGHNEPPVPVFYEKGDSAFGLDWKFVIMGYGCGLVFGFSAGYIMMTIGKPKWLVRMVQRVGYKVLRRLKRYR